MWEAIFAIVADPQRHFGRGLAAIRGRSVLALNGVHDHDWFSRGSRTVHWLGLDRDPQHRGIPLPLEFFGRGRRCDCGDLLWQGSALRGSGLLSKFKPQRAQRNILNQEVGRIIRWDYLVKKKGFLARRKRSRKSRPIHFLSSALNS